jgi:predicted DNA-binding protein (UPF0251 family)/predicted RNA-binding Zn-ribbon protein involved in translation (DUF1610 family)
LPPAAYFNPGSAPDRQAGEVRIGLDEWEALRLKDYLGLEQEECAAYMSLSQSSFQRILASARTKLACALVEGLTISIQGGNYRLSSRWRCWECGHEWELSPTPELDARLQCPSCGTVNIYRRGHGRHGWGPPPWSGHGGGRRKE